jgi:hypothetical protein
MDTLGERQIACPTCKTVLKVPGGCGGRIVRCGRCRQRFRLPEEENHSDDDIASWLDDRPEIGIGLDQEMEPAGGMPQSPGDTIHPPMSGPLRLVKVEAGSVLMEFPASRLLDPIFRCAMPRKCLQCSTKSHLYAHVIIYSGHMADSISLEAEHSAGALVLSDQEARTLAAEELLERLPKVPNVPHPANEPMPYWLCDMCSVAGVISGQITVNPATGQGTCRLKVNNVRQAQEFLIAIGGTGANGYNELERMLAQMVENPWESVPLAVQHRMSQWFKPEPEEHFLAYVPDRDHGRTEDGMNGVVVSNRRLVYHTEMRHREMHVGDNLQITVASHGHARRIAVRTDSWEVHAMTVDRDGLAGLRRALLMGQFRPAWH